MTAVVVSQYDCIESKSCDGESDLCSVQLVDVYRLVEDQIDIPSVAVEVVRDFPTVARDLLLSWSESVLSDR